MKEVLILISTYNGALYLEEQLNSVFSQKGVKVKVLVRDDGSNDGTQEILRKYQKSHDLDWFQGENLGWARSFMELLYAAPDCDYYSFCDQDDIWLPEKLNVAVSTLENMQSTCKMYCSNLSNYKDGEVLGNVKPEKYIFNKYKALMFCINYGCTCVFNKALRNMMTQNRPSSVFAHDYWVYLSAIYLGDVYYDPNSYMLYRQHSSNAVGGSKSRLQEWKIRIRRMKKLNNQHERETMAKELLSCYSDSLSDTDKAIISVVADYRKNFRARMKLFFDMRYSLNIPSNNILLRLRILFGFI